jgi:hypothetical protein
MKDVVDGGAKCINMHREYDGEQDLNFYYFSVEDIVRDLFADPLAKGKQHMQFKADIGPDGRRLFTDAHTCLAFELAARETGDSDAVPYSLVLYIDGTSQWRNVSVLPVYITSRNYDKSFQGRPSTWRLLAVVPVLKMSAGTLSRQETTYRRKEVFLVHLSPP